MRLVEGSGSREGRLEILRDGVWGGVCATNYGTNTVNEVAAKAICSMLGFGYVYSNFSNLNLCSEFHAGRFDSFDVKYIHSSQTLIMPNICRQRRDKIGRF